MTKPSPRALATLAALLVSAAIASEDAMTQPDRADLILHGGRVLTMLEVEPVPAPTAVAVGGGHILYVGDEAGAKALAAPAARVIDVKGGTIIPGFIDSHAHLYGLGKALAEIDLRGTATVQDAVARVKEAAAVNPGRGWLEGRGWDQNDWPVKEYPHREMLDRVAGKRPVLLRRVDGHAAWASTAALALAGVTAATPDPAGGSILRDAQGEPTGVLIDNAVSLVTAAIPAPDEPEVRRRLRLAAEHCLRLGVTSVHDAGVSWERAQLMKELAAAGDLGVRVHAMYDDEAATLAAALQAGPWTSDDGMLSLRAVKLYADGALGSRGALLLGDYSDQPGHRGLAVTNADHLRWVMRTLGGAGFQVCTHAIGDGGNRLVLDLYEEVLGELKPRDARWRVEHAQILDPADIPRFAKLGVIAAMQPVHCTSDMDWADERLGAERLKGAYAWQSLLKTGAHLCYGTDFPVEKVEPLEGLYAARTRMHPDGTPIGGWRPEEAVDARTALWLYTAGGAWAAFAEDQLGVVAPGYRADLVVLDGDPVGGEAKELLGMKVTATVVGGRLWMGADADR
ncbi:MAG: amidohydrolase [bacterium]|nr:amidohydrolase [bacterium]